MDPTANLEEQLELAQSFAKHECDYGCPCSYDVKRLVELVLALNEWLAKGGSFPDQWAPTLPTYEQFCSNEGPEIESNSVTLIEKCSHCTKVVPDGEFCPNGCDGELGETYSRNISAT